MSVIASAFELPSAGCNGLGDNLDILYLMHDDESEGQSMGIAQTPGLASAWISRRWWLPLIPAAILMLIGFIRLEPGAASANPSLYEAAGTARLAWSDIISFYGRTDLAHHAFPYTTGHSFEYPVLTGLVFYLAGFAGYSPDATPAFVINYLLLAASGLVLLALISRVRGANPWLFALAPALVLYTGLNWDLLAILPGIAALFLYRERRDMSATVLLAISVWLKFFAILWLPLVLFERLRKKQWEDCLKIGALFTTLSLVNLPFILNNRTEWATFFTFNQNRAPEVNFWTIIRDYHLSIGTINLLSLLSIVAVLLGLFWVQWRHQQDLTLPAAAVILIWYFFIGKVYSPQYFIWILAFLAILATPLWLAVSLWFIDLIYYVASFQILHVCASGCTPQLQSFSNWDFDHILEPAMELREVVFLLLMVWIALRFFPRRAYW
jgi:hypothetical protein